MSSYILEMENIKVRYSGLPVLQGVSVSVKPGETVCVVGSNGSGKSTLLRAIMGSQRVFEGIIKFRGTKIQKLRTEEIVRLGIIYVLEEKMLFKPLSVEENLHLGAYVFKKKEKIQENLDLIYGLFPRLKERRNQAASTKRAGSREKRPAGNFLRVIFFVPLFWGSNPFTDPDSSTFPAPRSYLCRHAGLTGKRG